MNIDDWQNLDTAKISKWLVDLCSEDKDRQYQAKLDLGTYLKQHSYYLSISKKDFNELLQTDTPIWVTYFLIETLKGSTPANLEYVLELLEIVPIYKAEPALEAKQRKRAEFIYDLVLQQTNFLLGMLAHPSSDVRVWAMNVLDHLDEKQEEIASALWHHLKASRNLSEYEKLTVLEIVFIAVKQSKTTDIMRSDYIKMAYDWLAQEETSTSVKFSLATYLLTLEKTQVSQDAINTFVDLLKNLKFMPPAKESLPLPETWIKALLSLNLHQATRIILDVFSHQTDKWIILQFALVLLELYFRLGNSNDDPIVHHHDLGTHVEYDGQVSALVSFEDMKPILTSEGELSEIQRDILKQFIAKDELWTIKTNLFELYNLPTDRATMLSNENTRPTT